MANTKSLLIFLIIALFASVLVLAKKPAKDEEEKENPNSDVVTLTEKNFDEFVGKHEFVLIEFYAPWCPHCKDLAPKYEKVATELKGKIPVAKVNCDKNKGLAQRFNIPGFPIVKLFKNAKPFRDYEEERAVDAIVAWALRKTGPSATSLSADAVEEFVKKNANVNAAIIVGYFSSKDTENFKSFTNASDTLDDFVFGEVIAEGQTEKVKVFRSHFGEEDTESAFDGNLVDFLTTNGYPLVDEINAKTFNRYAAANLPLAVVFLNYENTDEKNEFITLFRKIGSSFRGKFNFGYSDGNVYGEQLEMMGGNKTTLPGLAAMNLETRKNFPYTGAMEAKAITDWANGILDGSVEPYLKSEPIPETNDEPVKVIVGKTFDSIVMDETKDVLLEFYAPWCGHCQKLAPKYEKLAESLSSAKNLVIGKIDATQNDTPINVEGFPTIIFFPKGAKKEPITYEGNRSINDLKSFIKKNAVAAKEELAALKDNAKTETKKTEKSAKDEL